MNNLKEITLIIGSNNQINVDGGIHLGQGLKDKKELIKATIRIGQRNKIGALGAAAISSVCGDSIQNLDLTFE